jgi:hypothetical protein
MERAQASLEYLAILATAIAITAIVTLLVINNFSGQQNQYLYASCRQAASTCKITLGADSSAECSACNTACNLTNGSEIYSGAAKCCKVGLPDQIYVGSPGCGAYCLSDLECTNKLCCNKQCTTPECDSDLSINCPSNPDVCHTYTCTNDGACNAECTLTAISGCCLTNADCSSGQVCNPSHACVTPKCSATDPCPAAPECYQAVCNNPGAYNAYCSNNSMPSCTCQTDQTCINLYGSTYKCNTATQQCVQVACFADADCKAYPCKYNYCINQGQIGAYCSWPQKPVGTSCGTATTATVCVNGAASTQWIRYTSYACDVNAICQSTITDTHPTICNQMTEGYWCNPATPGCTSCGTGPGGYCKAYDPTSHICQFDTISPCPPGCHMCSTAQHSGCYVNAVVC